MLNKAYQTTYHADLIWSDGSFKLFSIQYRINAQLCLWYKYKSNGAASKIIFVRVVGQRFSFYAFLTLARSVVKVFLAHLFSFDLPPPPTGTMYFVFCRIYPSSSTCHLSTLSLYRRYRIRIAYPYEWGDFMGAKEKTSLGLLVFNPLC